MTYRMHYHAGWIIRHFSRAALLAWIGGLLLVSPAQAQFITCPDGGELKYAEIERVATLNPHDREDQRGPDDRLFSLIYETLATYDFESREYIPKLAESWTLGPDARSVIFNLRRGVTWHDGTPFTAEDVVFTYDYIKERAPEVVDDLYYSGLDIESVTAQGEYTVVATFSRERSENLAARAFTDTWIIPKHTFTDNYGPAGEPLYDLPIGTGPYQFRTETAEGNIRLEVFEGYWGDRAHIEEVLMRQILDEGLLVSALLSGGVDLLVRIPPEDVLRVEEAADIITKPYTSFTFHAFGYRFTHPDLSNFRLRRALTIAVDREQMLEQWYDGKGSVIGSPVVPNTPYYDETVTPFPHRPDIARTELDTLGYRDRDGDGFRERPDGSPFSLRLLYPVGEAGTTTVNQNVAESYQFYLEQAGVRVELDGRQIEEYLDRRRERDFDVVWVDWTFGTSYNITDLFYSGATAEGEANFIQYNNPEVDNYLRRFNEEIDPDRRTAIMNRLQRLLKTEAPYTFLYSINNYSAYHRRYINTNIDPYFFFSYFKDWCISPRFLDE